VLPARDEPLEAQHKGPDVTLVTAELVESSSFAISSVHAVALPDAIVLGSGVHHGLVGDPR
jgi:hypothetical protein